ncbi:MAG: UDP-N-acetylglucosamine pyrophosphorylase [Clostridia bacterium]|nr:UDP-N-acetylglucosamine pyrophosphorylase [Clostridia bacterium]
MNKELLAVDKLLDLTETIANKIFESINFPWEVLSEIESFIMHLGPTLSEEKFYKCGQDIWIAKSAQISKSASLSGPLIIDEKADVRHCAFIRKNAIIGKNAVVGNSTELKNTILFNNVQVPHYNYVGDSILGYKAHLGAGAITSNVKSTHGEVSVSFGEEKIATNLKKFGAIIADNVEIGCNTVLNPGTIVGKNSVIYPLQSVRGFIPENCIYKSAQVKVKRQPAQEK